MIEDTTPFLGRRESGVFCFLGDKLDRLYKAVSVTDLFSVSVKNNNRTEDNEARHKWQKM